MRPQKPCADVLSILRALSQGRQAIQVEEEETRLACTHLHACACTQPAWHTPHPAHSVGATPAGLGKASGKN